jgi:hypothetical protein
MTHIETDYLVVGAGAAGMAFTDDLLAHSDADVVMVERRHRPGGHWRNAYPFVRLHQPSPFYGVNSRVLGTDSIDQTGPNAGFYQRARGNEIVDYFDRVLDETFLPSGRVRFFGMSDYLGQEGGRHTFVSRLTGETTEVTVRRRLVDATYLETPIPSTSTPNFEIDPGVRVIPVNGLVDVTGDVSGYTILGAGKTAMDACCWLLDGGVPPDDIRWIRPRDAWMLDRANTQPLSLVPQMMEGVARDHEAAAGAESVADLFARLEAAGQLVRIDQATDPAMYRCATISSLEIDQLRTIEQVIRLGRVRRIGPEVIELVGGTIPTGTGQVLVDCTAEGLRVRPARPIFEPGRITLQQIRTCQPTFNAAVIGFVESLDRDDTIRNGLCPPNPYPSAATDWITAASISSGAESGWFADPEVTGWLSHARLNAARGVGDYADDPVMQSALGRYLTNVEPAQANLARLAATLSPVSSRPRWP